ncbi:MAG: winged helix-turn-helix transcriptional regulator [Solirubrobacteraceae bacterium]
MQHAPPSKRHPYDQWTPDARALDLVGDKWTLLIVRDLAAGPRRFVELQRVLPGISTEQLRSRLNRMVADGMLTRRRFREVPPRVEYELTERARDLMPTIGELARWGYAWTWSAPREGEQIDIDAIFRLAPGLARLERDARGRVELTVTDGRENEPVTLVMTVSAGEVSVEEGRAEIADARITAPTSAWVRAFLPAGDRDGLRIEGDRGFAMGLLDALTPQDHDSERAERVHIA